MDIKSAILAGAIQLTSLEVGTDPVQQSTANSYDGTSREISRFYKPENTNIQLGVNIQTDPNSLYKIKVDTGHDTMKYDEDLSLTLGIVKRHHPRANHTLTWGVEGTIGGNVKHTPCYDEYNRQYYCQSLTAWSDFTPEREKNDEHKASINYSIRF